MGEKIANLKFVDGMGKTCTYIIKDIKDTITQAEIRKFMQSCIDLEVFHNGGIALAEIISADIVTKTVEEIAI